MQDDQEVAPPPVRVGNVTLDLARREVVIAGAYSWQPQRLQFRVLLTLARNVGRLVTFERIMRVLYPPGDEEIIPADRTIIPVVISRIRANLEAGGADLEIRNLRGEGYILGAIAARPVRGVPRRVDA